MPKERYLPLSRARSVLAVVLLALFAAVSGATRPALAEECSEAISAETAQKLFDALRGVTPSDGCTLETVRTEKSQATVVWKKGGNLQDGVLVAPTSCVKAPTARGKVLSAVVPPATARACPAASEALGAILAGDAFSASPTVSPAPDAARPPARPPSRIPWKRSLLAALVVAVVSAALLALRRPLRKLLRRPTPRGASRAGWGAALLLGPHIVLGTWLVVVPDHVAFTTTQVITLVHVLLAVITFPVAGAWILWHVRGMRAARPRGEAGARAVRWLLTAAAIVAAATGLVAIRGGDIAPTAAVHAASCVAVGIPLALHLWLSSRRRAALAVASLLVVGTAGSALARRLLPPTQAEAVVPTFAFSTRPEGLYEPAEHCGECHVQDYADWKRSTHARTLEMASVREAMERQPNLLHEDLGHIGQLMAERDRPLDAALVFGACGSCHAPTSFYGDGKPSLLHPDRLTAEGTGCSFCHTLRAVRRDREAPQPTNFSPTSISNDDIFAVMSRAPLFVSAPETVRRYLGQGSENRFARRISNWLIRWRPQVHAADYHSPVLDDSRACLPCHSLGVDAPEVPHMTYFAWERSPFNTGDPKTTVECQDCHMARHMTGEPVNEEAREVPWGPLRPRARSHLFLGGNALFARSVGDEPLARAEHDFNVGVLSVAIPRAVREGDAVSVTVTVRSDRVGHHFPALETKLRYGWVVLEALDAAGKVLGQTAPPRDSDDFGASSPLIMSSTDDIKPDTQRLIPARSARDYDARIPVPAGAAVDRVVAELHEFVDAEPIARATRALGR